MVAVTFPKTYSSFRKMDTALDSYLTGRNESSPELRFSNQCEPGGGGGLWCGVGLGVFGA